ncbi:response regulator [Microbacterium sp. 179-B 1A2 NHS]|uniref:response regulator n=1 Tax=Microbacterium sp. 179-B 1A2 NHS TaxID=3142383 RepID=UPI00399F9C1D
MTGIRTLIVDDDFAVARLHASFLGRIPGFELVGSELTAADALARVRGGDLDLLLLDMYLPDASGIELLRRLRADPACQVDVIMVSAAHEPALVEQAISLGVVDFLLKPFTHDDFRARLAGYATRVRERRLVSGLARLSQGQVDTLLKRGPVGAGTGAAKGMNPVTRQRVLEALAGMDSPITALEAADATGLSRVSARRYLERLVHDGVVEMQPRYGEAGRPQHEYWIGS